MSRVIKARYLDPLELCWLATAERVGLRIERSSEVFASTDGRGVLTIGAPETLDADDCLAQMIFHELCHAIVQGPGALDQPDWGLGNQDERDVIREHATLRLQRALLSPRGLATLLAPTTDFRGYYDALSEDPLQGEGEAAALARAALEQPHPYREAVEEALDATEQIARALAAITRESEAARGTLWAQDLAG